MIIFENLFTKLDLKQIRQKLCDLQAGVIRNNQYRYGICDAGKFTKKEKIWLRKSFTDLGMHDSYPVERVFVGDNWFNMSEAFSMQMDKFSLTTAYGRTRIKLLIVLISKCEQEIKKRFWWEIWKIKR